MDINRKHREHLQRKKSRLHIEAYLLVSTIMKIEPDFFLTFFSPSVLEIKHRAAYILGAELHPHLFKHFGFSQGLIKMPILS